MTISIVRLRPLIFFFTPKVLKGLFNIPAFYVILLRNISQMPLYYWKYIPKLFRFMVQLVF